MILSLILFPIAVLIWFWRDAQWQNRVWSEKAARVRADQDRRTVKIMLGSNAGVLLTSAVQNTVVGINALSVGTVNSGCVAVDCTAAEYTTGNFNTAVEIDRQRARAGLPAVDPRGRS